MVQAPSRTEVVPVSQPSEGYCRFCLQIVLELKSRFLTVASHTRRGAIGGLERTPPGSCIVKDMLTVVH